MELDFEGKKLMNTTSSYWETLTWFVVLWWNATFRLWIVQLAFFWPRAKTNKKIEGQITCNRSFN